MPQESLEKLKRQRQEQLFEQLHVECQRLAVELESLKENMVKSEATRRAEHKHNGEGGKQGETEREEPQGARE